MSMSNSKKKRARDNRPKVISFPTILNGLNIAAMQSILWPCHAFNISIPQKSKSELNVFEQTVLKLTEIESGITENIALLTCLDKELVAFIQNRLNQLGFLDDRYEISAEGKILLESWLYKEDSNLEYVAGTILIDLISGKLLPYIHIGALKQKKIVSIDKDFVMVELGSTGKSRNERCRKISPETDYYWNTVPDSNNIIRAIREFKRKFKRHALLNKNIDQYPPPVPIAEAISILEKPEMVYLHCNVLIQQGNSELLVTDGFGFGFSESFASFLTSRDFGWVTDMKQKGVIDEIGSFEASNNQSSFKKYKYDEISRRVIGSKTALDKVKCLKINSSNYQSDHRHEIENGLKNLYSALEWSLRQVVAENPVFEWEQVFASSNFIENERLLIGFAKKVGFYINANSQSLLQVKPGAIRQIEKGKVELQPLLALAIAGANCNANHPINRLAKNHPDFLSHVLRLKKYRDPIEHGNTEKLDVDDKILEELIELTVPIIVSLVPDVANDFASRTRKVSDGDINQERLKANINLEKVLGTAFVSSLAGDVKEQLIRAEIMLTNFTLDKTIEIIKCYASVLQHVLLDAVSDRAVVIASENIRDIAVSNIIKSGFYSDKNQVPVELTTVKIKLVKRAIQGSSTSLGANAVAVFLSATDIELFELQKCAPEFVDVLANLIRLRGHGNKQLSDFTKEQIESVIDNSLKNNVLKLTKTIVEVF